jgi:hypothetical protein
LPIHLTPWIKRFWKNCIINFRKIRLTMMEWW